VSSTEPRSARRQGPLASLTALLRLRLRGSGRQSPASVSPQSVDPLQEAGWCLRRAREARGLSLRQLAGDTRISTAVLEALEKGWRDRLPEPTYLRGMLCLLEQHLQLPAGALQAVLPQRVPQAGSSLADPRLRRFSPTAIELFSTWQGCLLYGVLCLALIYGLNRQQQQLASRGLLSLRPLPPLPAAADRPDADSSDRLHQRLLTAYPDVRPLERAGRGQALALIRQSLRAPVRPGSVAGSGTASGTRHPATATDTMMPADGGPQPPATRP